MAIDIGISDFHKLIITTMNWRVKGSGRMNIYVFIIFTW